MRTIKFRAWDKIDNKMYYDVGLSLIGVQVYKNPNEQPPEAILLDRGRDCFEIMQFTGLTDKTGLDIYEGDIVVIPAHWEGDHSYKMSNAEVVFEDAEFFCRSYMYGYCNLFDSVRNYGGRVIGNIYENPQLLKEEQK